MYFLWGLVPLGALGLLLLSFVGVVLGFAGGRLSAGMARVALLLPLLIILPVLCGCLPLSSPVVTPLMASSTFDLNSVLAGLGYGFWIALAGLAAAGVGVLLALLGGLIARPR